MTQGTIVQCIGAVTDIQFPREAMPKVYDALVLEESSEASFARWFTFMNPASVRCRASSVR